MITRLTQNIVWIRQNNLNSISRSFSSLFTSALVAILLPISLIGQIDAVAKLDSNSIMIGDQLNLRIEIAHIPDLKVQEIDISPLEVKPEIEIINQSKLDTVYNKEEVILRKDLTITSFDSGYHWIPEIPVQYTYQGQTSTVKTLRNHIEVRTFPITTDTLALQPIKDIIAEPINFWDALPFIAGGLGLVAIGILVWYLFFRKPKEAEPKVIFVDNRPAHIIALEQLETLKKKKLWQSGAIKTFHTELTYIFREYLERRFEIRALESTSDEILVGLRNQNKQEIEERWYQEILKLLQVADLVKFAKAEPPIQMHEEMLSLTERFIRYTKEEERLTEPLTTEEQED